MDINQATEMMSDEEMIEHCGGATKVAAVLGFTVQRVQNWKKRGIPPQVRLDHPEMFQAPNGKRRSSDKVTPP